MRQGGGGREQGLIKVCVDSKLMYLHTVISNVSGSTSNTQNPKPVSPCQTHWFIGTWEVWEYGGINDERMVLHVLDSCRAGNFQNCCSSVSDRGHRSVWIDEQCWHCRWERWLAVFSLTLLSYWRAVPTQGWEHWVWREDSLTSTKLHSSKIKQQHVTVGVRFETLFTRSAVTDSRYVKQKGYPKTGRETFFFM